MSIPEGIIKNWRLSALQVLIEAPDLTANEGDLEIILRHFGVKPTRDQLRDVLTYLADGGLVTLEKIPRPSGDALWMARVTEMGQRVAKGYERRVGIARPGEI